MCFKCSNFEFLILEPTKPSARIKITTQRAQLANINAALEEVVLVEVNLTLGLLLNFATNV